MAISTVLALAAAALAGASVTSATEGSRVIAYIGHGTLYTINADGTGRQSLLSGVADNTFAWSPDAQWIAFTAGKWGADASQIKVARSDGTHVRTLTRGLPASASAGSPTWSPDGKRIAFMAWSGRRWSVFVINADGSGMRELKSLVANDENPDWSPDGRWIVFERFNFNTPRSTVLAVHPNGTGLRTIATVINGPQCACPDWSPDGSKIAYQGSPTVSASKYPEIYVMNADGSSPTQLTHNRVRDENPDWSPDGTRIAFYSEQPGNAEIYVINADGTGIERITHDPWYSALPRWRPGP
jgi:TolB protein